ncbi:MAG: hypothetical protein ACP5GU_04910 [Thermoprotei archaeon]
MNYKISIKLHSFTDHSIKGTFGIFGLHSYRVAMKILHDIYERDNLLYIVIDRYGNYKNLVKSDDAIFLRVGSNVSLNIFHHNKINHEEYIIMLTEMLQRTLGLDNEHTGILIEILLELFSNEHNPSLSLLINGLKTRQSLAGSYELSKIASLIRLLYPLYLGSGLLAFDKGCKYLFDDIEYSSKPVIFDLSKLSSTEAKNLASLIIILKLDILNIDDHILFIDSVNQLFIHETSQKLRTTSFQLIFDIIDKFLRRNVIIGLSSPSIIDVNPSLIARLSTLLIAKEVLPQTHNIYKEYSSIKKNEWILISNDLSEPIIINIDLDPWILSEIDDEELSKLMKTLGYEFVTQIDINKISLPTILETLFKDRSTAASDLLNHASLMLLTRSEAINILKKYNMNVEECEELIDSAIMHNLLKELVISGRKLLHITTQGSVVLNEYKLKRGEYN